jgi:tetraacyldisaccharide-1-P 4'-kinase
VLVHDFSITHPVLRDFPFWLNRADLRVSFSEVPPFFRKKEWVRAQYKIKESVDNTGKTSPLPSKALLFCGVGNPKRVVRQLEKHGVQVAEQRFFKDHHEYTHQDALMLAQWQKKKGGFPLLTTLKDYVKIQDFADVLSVSWMRVEVEFLENEVLFWKKIDEVVDGFCDHAQS